MKKETGPGSPFGDEQQGPGSRTSQDSDAIQSNSPTSTPGRRTPVTPLYLALARALEQRRLALGISQEHFCELAGLSDRVYSKAFISPDSAAGRQVSWPIMQIAFDTGFPDGIDLRVIARTGPALDALSHRYALRFDKIFAEARTRREQLREWGRKGGSKHSAETMKKLGRRGGRSRAKKLSKAKLSELARRASRARWKGQRGKQMAKPEEK